MEDRTCQKCGGSISAAGQDGLCPACIALRGLASNTQIREARRASEWSPPSADEIALEFPELDQLQLIGRGGMGAVYRARQKNLDRTVALKILPPQLLTGQTFAQRFAREAQAMARLNHPNIVTIHDFGRRGELFYFIMEFVDGLTLRQLMGRGKLAPSDAMAIIPQICEGLEFAHEQGIVHRDIKPENILLTRRGQVKIADFGLAKLVEADREHVPVYATTGALGTPLYMAPEQLDSPEDVDHRADIYSLGVVIYELLTGEIPDEDFQPLSRSVHVDARLDELVTRALDRNRDHRFGSVLQLHTALRTIATTPRSAAELLPDAPLPPIQESTRASQLNSKARLEATRRLNWPSRGIEYAAIANIVFLWVTTVPALVSFVASAPEKVIETPLGLHLTLPWWATGTFLYTILSMILNVCIVAGANRMRDLRSYSAALAAAILSLFAAPANVAGAIFGMWAIAILARHKTRGAFGSSASADEPARSLRLGLASWLPLAADFRSRKIIHPLNYLLLASTLWLLCVAAFSLVVLGRPSGGIYLAAMAVPAIAATHSIARLHRRLSSSALATAQEKSQRLAPMVLRFGVFIAALLLYATTNQALAVRELAQQRASTTKPTVIDRLHLSLPKIAQ